MTLQACFTWAKTSLASVHACWSSACLSSTLTDAQYVYNNNFYPCISIYGDIACI